MHRYSHYDVIKWMLECAKVLCHTTLSSVDGQQIQNNQTRTGHSAFGSVHFMYTDIFDLLVRGNTIMESRPFSAYIDHKFKLFTNEMCMRSHYCGSSSVNM